MIYRTYLFVFVTKFLVSAQEESEELPMTPKTPRSSLIGTAFMFLKRNPEIRNTLTALLFGVAVFLFIMNIHKL